MKKYCKSVMIVIAVFSLSACNAQNNTSLQTTLQESGYSPPALGIVWITDENNNITHTPTGTVFPAFAGKFERFNTKDYNSDGSDVGASYHLENNKLTLYATYDSKFGVVDHMNQAVYAIKNYAPSAKFINSRDLDPSDTKYDQLPVGHYVDFLINENEGLCINACDGEELTNGIWMFKRGDWVYKARMTFLGDPLTATMKTLEEELNKEMEKSGSDARASLSSVQEGIPLGMEDVLDALISIKWPTN